MTVLENLMLVGAQQSGENLLSTWLNWGRVSAEEKALGRKAEEVIEFLELDHLRDQLAGNLSGGQKKLLELGRTMMTDARFVLLDEPGAGVNRTLLAKLSEDIQRLNRERGYTFCVVEHDMDFVRSIANKVTVLHQGSVLAEGTMDHVQNDPKVIEVYLGA